MGNRADAPQTNAGVEKYFKIPVHLFKAGDRLERDIFLLYQKNYLNYRPKNSVWTTDDTEKLKEFGANELYIFCEDETQHFKFLESNLSRVLGEANTTTKDKANVLYECATGIAEGLFKNPISSESLQRSKRLVTNTIDLLAKDSNAFLEMISLSSHDYYTYTHCVNVMTFTIGLLSALGEKDRKILEEAAIGAFLHDIGKSKVPLEVLNKPGALTPDEWKIMKKHPEWGVEILGSKQVPFRSKEIVLQHHEKINGIGYPHGLRGDQIHTVSQVVSVCDAYDAMTTNRCYQRALSPMEAFQIIAIQMKGHFIPKVVETFIQLLNLDKLKKK